MCISQLTWSTICSGSLFSTWSNTLLVIQCVTWLAEYDLKHTLKNVVQVLTRENKYAKSLPNQKFKGNQLPMWKLQEHI